MVILDGFRCGADNVPRFERSLFLRPKTTLNLALWSLPSVKHKGSSACWWVHSSAVHALLLLCPTPAALLNASLGIAAQAALLKAFLNLHHLF